MRKTLLKLIVALSLATCGEAFVSNARGSFATLQSTVSDIEEPIEDNVAETLSLESTNALKKRLFQLGASYDRGYGATSSSREEVMKVITDLEKLNPSTDASKGILGNEPSPLEGSWRMVWTTAQDVLVLGASPVATVGAIYQVFDPPVVTNIIDFIPKAQALLPPLAPSLLRAEVTTRGSPRQGLPLRVGLNFESVKLKPVELLGFSVDNLPPLGFDLPQIPGASSETSPGYFDVAFLDDELLIIRQNAPGGVFALVKTEDFDP